MAEREGGGTPEAGEEAKEVVRDFVQILGLLDIIQGGLLLYWVRLRLGAGIGTLFPSSDYEVLNIALLLCVAAILGKAVSLVVAFLVALVRMLLEGGNVLGYHRRLEAILDAYVDRTPGGVITKDHYRGKRRPLRPQELAAEITARANPGSAQTVERLRTNISFSYSLALLLVLYTDHFSHTPALGLTRALGGGVVLFFALGVLSQLDLARTLGTLMMVQLQPPEKHQEGSHENPH